MEDAKKAYNAFNALWSKVPRHVRVDRENHQRMLEVRAYFDAILEAAKRAAIVNTALVATDLARRDSAAQATTLEEEELNVSPIHLALRLLRTLSRREWEMTKAIVDLHKFPTEDFLEILDEIRDVHCPRCGEWLDDEDEHEDCPVPEEEEDDESPDMPPAAVATTAASTVEVVPPQSTVASPEPHVLAVMPKPVE